MKTRRLSAAILGVLSLLALVSFSGDEPIEAQILAPERDEADPLVRPGRAEFSMRGDYSLSYPLEGSILQGFEVVNDGPNRIVPVRGAPGEGPYRSWRFHFKDRARQDIHLEMTDVPNSTVSHAMESYFYFFPRKVLPAIQWPSDPAVPTYTIVLPTEERVEMNRETHEVVSGVLEETAPIDLGPDRFQRKFAQIWYSGQGVLVRVDKRGSDPRLGTEAVISRGSRTCRVPSSLLFDQNPRSAVLFKFLTDEAFDVFLKNQCGFGVF